MCVSLTDTLNIFAFVFLFLKYSIYILSWGPSTFQVGNLGENKTEIKGTLLESAILDFAALLESSFLLMLQIFPHVAKENNVRKGVWSMFIVNYNKTLQYI